MSLYDSIRQNVSISQIVAYDPVHLALCCGPVVAHLTSVDKEIGWRVGPFSSSISLHSCSGVLVHGSSPIVRWHLVTLHVGLWPHVIRIVASRPPGCSRSALRCVPCYSVEFRIHLQDRDTPCVAGFVCNIIHFIWHIVYFVDFFFQSPIGLYRAL